MGESSVRSTWRRGSSGGSRASLTCERRDGMAVEKNKETFRCYVDKVWKGENLDIADEIFAAKYLYHQSNGTVTAALVLLLGAISLDRLDFGMVLSSSPSARGWLSC